jgi:hypothetical protein
MALPGDFSGNAHMGSSSPTPTALVLTPNCPPIAYPALSTPDVHGPTEINTDMEIDGPEQKMASEDNSMEEEADEDASSEVSDGEDLKACLLHEGFIIQLITLSIRVTWRTLFRGTLTSRETMPLQPLFRMPLTLACTSKVLDLSDCRSVSGMQSLL